MRKIGCILAAVCLCFGMSSCSEDEDGQGGGSGDCSAKLDNKTFSAPYGFWYMADELGGEIGDDSKNKNKVLMQFMSYNPTSGNLPGEMSVVLIAYKLPEGEREISSTVVKAGKYEVSAATGLSMSSDGLQGSTDNDFNANDSDLKIGRNGNQYTISIDNATLIQEGNGHNNKLKFSFNFSGPLTHKVAVSIE